MINKTNSKTQKTGILAEQPANIETTVSLLPDGLCAPTGFPQWPGAFTGEINNVKSYVICYGIDISL